MKSTSVRITKPDHLHHVLADDSVSLDDLIREADTAVPVANASDCDGRVSQSRHIHVTGRVTRQHNALPRTAQRRQRLTANTETVRYYSTAWARFDTGHS